MSNTDLKIYINLIPKEKLILAILSSYQSLDYIYDNVVLSDFYNYNTEYLFNKYKNIIVKLNHKLDLIFGLDFDNINLKHLPLTVKQKYQLLNLEEVIIYNAKLKEFLKNTKLTTKDEKKTYLEEIFGKKNNKYFYLDLYFKSTTNRLVVNENIDVYSIYDVLESLKLTDIKCFDFINKSPFFDYVFIATANDKQTNALISKFKEHKIAIKNVESSSDWTLIDLYDYIVHVFSKDGRSFYNFDDKFLGNKSIDNKKEG